jgi:hypothetical protein
MMAGTRQFARNQTWMVFYPALAFFLAVLGFNLLGEGLRRMVQKRGVSTAFILSKRIVLVIAAITAATAYIVTHVGPAPSYASLAQRFDAAAAMSHVVELTAPNLEGRQAGTAGADATYVEMDHITQAVMFLASAAAEAINGLVLPISRGVV